MDASSLAPLFDFPFGLPGFENHHRFALIAHAPPLMVLESVDQPAVRFHTIPVSILDPQYQLDISRDQAQALSLQGLSLEDGCTSASNVLCLAILTASKDGEVTANLLAPIVANLSSGVAVQVVRSDQRHSHRHIVSASAPKEAECS
jgi:flagellar assembly factor FliW